MELCGIGMTRQRHPVGAITPLTLENGVKWSITIDPTVGSRSNFFHELRGISTNTPTASDRGNSTDSAGEPGQNVHNYRSDHWIALKFLPRVSGGWFRWNCVESV